MCEECEGRERARKRAGRVSEGEFFLSGLGGVVFVREGGDAGTVLVSTRVRRYRYGMGWGWYSTVAFGVVAR